DVLSDRNAESRWCDDVNTPRLETCDEILATSLEKALDDLRKRYGRDANRGDMDFADDAEPFANRHASSLRAIYDLADPDASRFIMPGGQSGNPFSAH